MPRAMQDIMPNHCYGCGAHNRHGLRIKSFWAGNDVVCTWRPERHHIGHPGILYGGMIASVVDCHCIWTAVAYAHRANGVEMCEARRFQYVTASLRVEYRKPVSIDAEIDLRARVREFSERKALVACTVTSGGIVCAEAEVLAVRMPGLDAREPAAAAAAQPA